jgi:hypothetical protein
VIVTMSTAFIVSDFRLRRMETSWPVALPLIGELLIYFFYSGYLLTVSNLLIFLIDLNLF